MSTDKKVEAIKGFLAGMAEIRLAVKEDARAMLAAMPPELLDDAEGLSDFLEEMAQEIAKKYLIAADGKSIAANTARLINRYVNSMLEE